MIPSRRSSSSHRIAGALLRGWFGERRDRVALAPEIQEWRARERGSPAPAAFELRRGRRRLELRLVAGEEEDAILVAERGAEPPHPELLCSRLPISGREAEVLALLARGWMNAAIAHKLGISSDTVNRHVEHIYAKLGVHNRAAATAAALAALESPPATGGSP